MGARSLFDAAHGEPCLVPLAATVRQAWGYRPPVRHPDGMPRPAATGTPVALSQGGRTNTRPKASCSAATYALEHVSRVKEAMLSIVSSLSGNMAATPLAAVVTSVVAGAPISNTDAIASAAYGTLLLGSTFIQTCRGKRAEGVASERFARVERALRKLATKQDEALCELADLALEQQWVRDALEQSGDSAATAFNAAWKSQVAAGLKELGVGLAQIQCTLGEMAILEFDTNSRVRGIEAALVGQVEKLDKQNSILDTILAEVKSRPTREKIEIEIRPQLEREIEARFRSEEYEQGLDDLSARAKRLADMAIAALNAKGFVERAAEVGGPHAVLENLQKQATDHELAAGHHEAASVALWRTTAEWASLVGEIGVAADALAKILSRSPDDLDALNQLGHVKKLLGRFDEAFQLYSRVGALATDDLWRAISLGNLGLIERARGNLDAAEEYHKKSLAIERRLGRQEGMAAAYGNLGLVEDVRRNPDAAEAYFKQALAIYESLGGLVGMAATNGNLGLVEQMRGNLDAAEAYLKKSLAIDERLGRREGMANQYGTLGTVEYERGNLDAAEEYFKKSLAIDERLGHREGMGIAFGNLGLVERSRGKLDAAEAYHKKSLAISETLGRQEGIASACANLGWIAIDRGNRLEAKRLWTLARDMFRRMGVRPLEQAMQRELDRLG